MPPATAGRSAAKTREHLVETLRPVVAALGYDLEDITVTSAGRRSLVRVTVDADGGIDLDAVADVSRLVSEAMDAQEPGGPAFAGPYVLEVSSPGVDRPLTEPRHWRRSVDRLVQVAVQDRTVTGRVRSVSDRGIVLDVEGSEREIAWSALGRGKVQVEFNRAGGEPGAGDGSEAEDN